MKVFDSDELPFSTCSYMVFVCSVQDISTRHCEAFLLFSSRGFTGLAFTLRSMILFELILYGLKFVFLHMNLQLFHLYLLMILCFFTYTFLIFVRNQLPLYMQIHFWNFYSVSLIYSVCLDAISTLSCLCIIF